MGEGPGLVSALLPFFGNTAKERMKIYLSVRDLISSKYPGLGNNRTGPKVAAIPLPCSFSVASELLL